MFITDLLEYEAKFNLSYSASCRSILRNAYSFLSALCILSEAPKNEYESKKFSDSYLTKMR